MIKDLKTALYEMLHSYADLIGTAALAVGAPTHRQSRKRRGGLER